MKLLFPIPNIANSEPSNGVWKQTLYPATECIDGDILVIFVVDGDAVHGIADDGGDDEDDVSVITVVLKLFIVVVIVVVVILTIIMLLLVWLVTITVVLQYSLQHPI